MHVNVTQFVKRCAVQIMTITTTKTECMEVDTAILFDRLPKREKFRKAVSRLPKLGNFIFIK